LTAESGADGGAERRPIAYVFEDDVVLREILVDVLREDGAFTVVPFESIAKLKEVAEGLKPDVIVADAWGPSYDTLMAEERHEIVDVGAIAPMVLTAGRDWAKTVAAAELGVVSILEKPFVVEDFLAHVTRCLHPSVTGD
jgi:DNA-binding NtrC family response regulator